MRKIITSLLIVTLSMVTSCGLLGTYDNVDFMVGIQIPIYDRTVDFGLHMILKDQAINKIQENQKTKLVEMYAEMLKFKENRNVQ